jgi:cyclopropane fatty-acyl-phospholipid synthase-like methyltransferase
MQSAKKVEMSDFDSIYAGTSEMFYGREPSIDLVLFVNSESMIPGPALDLGCGDGRNSLYLARLGFEVTGVDTSAVAIAKLRSEARQQALDLTALVGDVRDYQYPPSHYELVVANTILDHMEGEEEGNEVAEAMQATLLTDGYLFVTVHTMDDPGYRGESESNTARHVKRYFRSGELRDVFHDVKILRYHEEWVLDRRHGPPHYHSIARLMAQKC